MLSLLLLFQLLFFNISNGVVIDMSTGTYLVATKKWLEMGFSFINDQSWLSITSTTSNFVDPIILIGLPDIGGSLYTEGKALSSRLRNVVKSGSISFQVKLFQPNDSFCSKQWYVPTYLSNPVQISWTIVEKGAFNVSSNSQWSQFTIGTGLVNRSTSANQVWNIGFPSTCKVGGVSGKPCTYPSSVEIYQLGAIATIQTLVYDTYMLLRTNRIRRRDLTLALTPHDSSTASYFNFPISETAGFMVFMTERSFSCVENIGFETKLYYSITSTNFLYPFKLKYSQTPGLFGHLITQHSVTDSTSIRSFGRNTSSSYLITQEDYCDSSDPIHTTSETASVFVIGQLSTVGNVVCGVVYSGLQTSTPTNSPTKSPAANPTIAPTRLPSTLPTISPSTSTPSITPSQSPTNSPTQVPVLSPTSWPTKLPSKLPTKSPSSPSTKGFPTLFPVRSPTSSPTRLPSTVPSRVPSLKPTKAPTFSPTTSPPFSPTSSPTRLPTKTPKTKLP